MPKFVPVEKYPDLTDIAVAFYKALDSDRGEGLNQMLLDHFVYEQSTPREGLQSFLKKYEADMFNFTSKEQENLFRAIMTAKMSDYGMLDRAPSGTSEFLDAANTVFASRSNHWHLYPGDIRREETSLGQVANILSLVQHNQIKDLDASRRLLQSIFGITGDHFDHTRSSEKDKINQIYRLRKSILAEIIKYPNVSDEYFLDYFEMLNSEKSKRALLNVYMNKFDAKIDNFLKNSGPVVDEQKLEECLDFSIMRIMINKLKNIVKKDELRDSIQKQSAIEALDARLEALRVKYDPATILRTNLTDLTEKGLEAAYEKDLTNQIESLTLKLAEVRQEKADALAEKKREIEDKESTISSQKSRISQLEDNLTTEKENAQKVHDNYKQNVINTFRDAMQFIEDTTVEEGVFNKTKRVHVDRSTVNEKLTAIAKQLGLDIYRLK